MQQRCQATKQALPTYQGGDHSIPIAGILPAQLTQLRHQRLILIRPYAHGPLGGSWLAPGLTGPTLRNCHLSVHVVHRSSPPRRAQ
jgi:hypothetical protein